MFGPRKLAAGAAAILLPASLLLIGQSMHSADAAETASSARAAASVSSAKTVAAKKKRRVGAVSLTLTAPVSQPGGTPANPDAARSVADVKVAKAKAGTKVQIQAQAGTRWVNAAAGRTDRRGRAFIKVPLKRGGQVATYRAKVGPRVSAGVSGARFATADFTETFSGTSLGSQFQHRIQGYMPESSRACSKADEKATTVGGGVARVSVLKDTSRRGTCNALKDGKSTGRFAYRLNGHIGTEGTYSFRYGTAAARIKFQKARGQHGSFWLQPAVQDPKRPGPANSGAEIDIIEWFGVGAGEGKGTNTGITSFTYHTNARGARVKTGSWIKSPTSYLANKSDGWFKRYHVFSVEWTPKQYIFRIDGKESFRSRAGVSKVPQFLILSLLSSDYELAQGPGDRSLPQTMSVDWVRVWK